MTSTGHLSYIRPSFLPVLAACPAAAQMTFYVVSRFGEPAPEAAADIGSDIHACVMLALLPLTNDPEAQPDTEAALAKFPSLSGWDQTCVRRCIEFALALVRKTGNDFPDDGVLVLLEQHLDGSVLGIDRGGSADLVIVVPFRLVRLVDWKAGFLDQGDAADHDQLSSYAVMASATFNTKAVEVFLFQPRADRAVRASGARFSAPELKAQETWTRAVVAAATDPDPEAIAGMHCTHCRAIQRCPVAQEYTMRAAEAFNLIGDPKDPDAWGALVAAAKVAGKFSDDAQESAKGYAVAGGLISGWKLQPTGTTTKIDSRMAIQLAKDAGVVHLLLEHVTVKASAMEAIDAIGPACAKEPKSPSLRQVKASSP